MKNLVYILMLWPTVSLAAKPAAIKKEPGFTVLLLETGAEKAPYKKAFPEAEIYSLDDAEKVTRREVLPLAQQTQLFERAGLSDKVKKMDTFDRDMLVRYLRHFDIQFVQKKYRDLPPKGLEVAQRMLKER